ncbi:MAG: recombinase family protein [Clostridia bacterium]|nr:recombinase family protein [Clostridia bacterium]
MKKKTVIITLSKIFEPIDNSEGLILLKTPAIYARYSSHKQREESIEEQVAECKEYAAAHGLTIIDVFSDAAISGKTENRDAWQQMLDAAKRHSFETLLVYTVDRMGRDRYALTVAKKQLRDCGVEIIAIKQPTVDGPEGIILDALMDGLAEYYNADLARKVNRGMSDNARKCLANGSKPPLGYKVDPISKTYIIDEAQAEIVRFVFDAYISGEKIGDIVAACEHRGYRNSNGHVIDNNVIARLLKNQKYIGLYKWKDIEVPGGMPRIISDETFQLAQLRIQSMKH